MNCSTIFTELNYSIKDYLRNLIDGFLLAIKNRVLSIKMIPKLGNV